MVLRFVFNKKAQFVQLGFSIVLIFVVLLIWVFVYNAASQINDSLQASSDLSDESKAIVNNNVESYPDIFDGLGAFVIVGLWFFVLVCAWNAPSNPVWGVVGFLLVAVFGVVSMYLGNVWAAMY